MVFNIKQLNQFNYTNYDGIIGYVRNRVVPPNIRNIPRFREKFEDFIYNEDDEHLYYEPLNAIVAKDEQDRIYMLDIIYDTHPGFGLDHFYEIVRHNVINITKKRTSDFLRKQLEYQLTVQPRKKKVRAKVYNNPNKAWAMDLIDMTNNIDKRKKYILTIIDL